MVKVFISYRRSDSEADAGRLHDHLVKAFGESNIFLDVYSILPGQDFLAALEQQLKTTDLILVLIGPEWLNTRDADGRRRIDSPNDYVRFEIERALGSHKSMIPILIRDAKMPSAEQLPESIRAFSRKQALTMFHSSFARDVQSLIDSIHKVLASQEGASFPQDDFVDEIIKAYKEHFIIRASDEDYALQLYYGSATANPSFFGSHLLREALVHLIEEADTTGWQKSDNELDPEDFWLAVLRAVARSIQSTYTEFNTESSSELLKPFLDSLDHQEKP